ncbi:DUF4878 domain-containing protein [Weeksellaceae bacterium TAE3-ERU29]|nr:DUF4878 domain-containing protein [Weeksellaceae bacterium TAE3-ERU29]
MKKGLGLIMLLCSLFFVSCSGNKPGTVAEKFLTNLEKGNFEEAKKYSDESTAKLLDMVISFGGEKLKEEIKNKEGNAPKIEIVRVEENDDKATVYYKEEGAEKENKIDLKKIDGDWKVSMNKEDGKEGAGHNHEMDLEDNHDHSHDMHDHIEGGDSLK